MSTEIKFGDSEFLSGQVFDLSIPLKFNGPQPNAYGVQAARSMPWVSGGLVGDTRRGGSCNFEQYTLIPHCNGTHTECVGHITNKRISVMECLQDVLIQAVLVSVEAVGANGGPKDMAATPGDKIIAKGALESALKPTSWGLSEAALIIRTIPNDQSKLTRHYKNDVPPYFTTDAMNYIVECGFKHLLVDLPSIDRLYDEGRLANHRIFWNVEPESFEKNADTRRNSTITELIYVPNDVADGEYLLNLQIAPFEADASPSRPILFKAR